MTATILDSFENSPATPDKIPLMPPRASKRDALVAMERAVQAGNREHAPVILAAVGPEAGAATPSRSS